MMHARRCMVVIVLEGLLVVSVSGDADVNAGESDTVGGHVEYEGGRAPARKEPNVQCGRDTRTFE